MHWILSWIIESMKSPSQNYEYPRLENAETVDGYSTWCNVAVDVFFLKIRVDIFGVFHFDNEHFVLD